MLTHFSSFKLILSLIGVIFFCNTHAQVTKLKDIVGEGKNGRYREDAFGRHIAITDDIIVVGVPYHDYDSNDSNYLSEAGAAFVFYKDEGGKDNWGLKKKLTATGKKARNTRDLFGISVAIFNDIIVVGATDNGFDRNGENEIYEAGAAFIFYKNEGGKDNWGQKTKIVAEGNGERSKQDFFGNSVAIFNDIIVVCASYKESGRNTNTGAAYIFYKDNGGTDNWGQKLKLFIDKSDSLAVDGGFGNSVDMSNDVIVISALKEGYDENAKNFVNGAGAVYVFNRNEGGTDNWGLKKKLIAKGPNARNQFDNFGFSLTISNDIIAVGAPNHCFDADGTNFASHAGAIYLYYRNEGGTDNWEQKLKLVAKEPMNRLFVDYFGGAIALSDYTLIAGVQNYDFDVNDANELRRAGAAFVFIKDNGGIDNWGLESKLTGSGNNGRKKEDVFGYEVAISNKTIVVGIPNQSYDINGNDSIKWAGKATIFKLGFPVGITKTQKDNDISIGSEGKNIHFSFSTDEDYSINVYDLMGREIVQTSSNKNLSQTISLPNVATGYYLVKISQGYIQKAFKVYLQ